MNIHRNKSLPPFTTGEFILKFPLNSEYPTIVSIYHYYIICPYILSVTLKFHWCESVIYSDIIITISLYDIYIYTWFGYIIYHLLLFLYAIWIILKKSWWKSSGFSILQNLHTGAFSPSSRRGTGANWPISRKVASQTASAEWIWFHSRYFT